MCCDPRFLFASRQFSRINRYRGRDFSLDTFEFLPRGILIRIRHTLFLHNMPWHAHSSCLSRKSTSHPISQHNRPWFISPSLHPRSPLPQPLHQQLKSLLTILLRQHGVSLRMLDKRSNLLPLTIHPQLRTQQDTALKHPYMFMSFILSYPLNDLCSNFPSPGSQFFHSAAAMTSQICIQSAYLFHRPHHTGDHP